MMKSFLIYAFLLFSALTTAQDYPQIVTLETQTDKIATFTTIGMAEKKKEAADNAAKSLFYTLFFTGVDGINDGKPLITDDNPEYTSKFLRERYAFYIRSQKELTEPKKGSNKLYQTQQQIEIPYQTLLSELRKNKVMADAPKEYASVENTEGMVLPTIIVVPYKNDGESYESILQNDYDRRIAVSKVQDGFESRNITTVDLQAKNSAMKRRSEYEANSADSNDKQLLQNSGADVYVTVDMKKDSGTGGTRISLILKAYELASGSVLATKDAWTRRYNTTATDALCSYAVSDHLPAFLDDICKNFGKQANNGKRVTLQFAIDGASSMTMNTQVGRNNYSLTNTIRQWVRKNAFMGKYHMQGAVAESLIFDYVIIPPKDVDGLLMDAGQFAFMIESYLKEEVNVPCSSRVDGNTIYINIE